MKLLLIHSDYLEFQAKKETKVAEDIPEDQKSGRAEETLVVFTAAEKEDEENMDAVIRKSIDEINQVRDQVGAESVVIYPYAHLSESLATPEKAVAIMEDIKKELEGQGIEVLRAPFGWYKSFDLSCKGHPLSELSRTITPEPPEEEEEEVESEWKIIDGEGKEKEVGDFNPSEEFQKVIEYEIEETEEKGEEPPHVRLMREKELADYDSTSDPGNLRWYPKGKLVRDLLIDYVHDMTSEYGAVNVETPVMYDLGEKAVSEHSKKFGERQYRFESGKKNMVLRFAACFGMFSIMRDMYMSENDLPIKMYELSKYSFRREQRGEIVGLMRLRAFTMPDLHTVCED
ncbi:MAG: threonine--tRNA ligase, partial [Candidatus Aenigmatarchaeota archaeon]